MPDRLIRESWCASEKIDRLTPFEETVLARLIVNCDDFGRMDGRANVLCSRLFVTRRDVGPEQMRSAIAALEREGLVSRYAVAGKEYIQMRGWGEHQRIRTQRSKYPAPPDAAEASRGISLAYHAAEAQVLNSANAAMQTADAEHTLPGAMPGQGAQADFALPQPAADRSDMQQPAADRSDMHQPAADCSNMPQPAADCSGLRLESESNPNPNRNPKENPNRSRESKPIGSPAAPAGAVEGARAREAFSEFWKKYPKKAGRAEALEAYLREKAYLQQKTLLASLAEQCKNENWRKERGRFVPRAANWLTDHRWEETTLPPAADEGGTGPPSRREQELLRMVNDPIEALLRAEQEEV